MKEETTTMTVRLPVSLKRLFDDLCHANDITPNQVLRAAVRDYCAKNQQSDLFTGKKGKK